MIRLVALASLFAFVATSARAADGPSAEVPELKALSHYVGTWDVAVTSEDNSHLKGTAKAEWVLSGRFVRQTALVKSDDGSPDLELTTLMTYDTEQKVYRMWRFMSDGEFDEAKATWNEAAKTMTSIASDGETGNKTTTTADFSTPGVERWKIVSTNKAGDELFEIHGENQRRGE